MNDLTPPPIAPSRPAATVIVARPGQTSSEELEVYLVKRHHKSGFMANAHVFPGGRVEEQDLEHARALDLDRRHRVAGLVDGEDDVVVAAAFALAAIRETAEECGVLLARFGTDDVDPDRAQKVVAALRESTPFAQALDDAGLTVGIEGLVPVAWWLTPEAEPKRYDTRFFAAWSPAGHTAAPDLVETTDGAWLSPTAALNAYRDGEVILAPPTLVTLEDLVGTRDLTSLETQVQRPLTCVCPRLCTTDAGIVLALPGDPLHGGDGGTLDAVVGWDRTRIVQDAEGRFVSARA